tara:strand:- start:2604 stop:3539 length:936 start_codon:yes stop_codon:yes gene_type:complete
MSLEIIQASPQSTLQATPRTGMRHVGIPASGAADPVSHALGARLVGNDISCASIEITYGPFEAVFHCDAHISLAGAVSEAHITDKPVAFHETLKVRSGETLKLGHPATGLRTYVSVAGGFKGEVFASSTSTYLPAHLGGFDGRALKQGDMLAIGEASFPLPDEPLRTPSELQLPYTNAFALRATPGPDLPEHEAEIWARSFSATRRASRIGIELDGDFPAIEVKPNLPSAGILPGALQLPPQGRGFLLLPDCQTTGGYPHILQVNRSDRHLMGQIRPGDSVMFLKRTPDEAAADLKEKQELLLPWMPDFRL